MWSGRKTTGTCLQKGANENKRENNNNKKKKSKIIKVLVFCDQSIDAKIIEPSFFLLPVYKSIVKNRSSACESLNTSVCIF